SIPFDCVSPDGRVITLEDAEKLMHDRVTRSLRVQHCMKEAERFLDACEGEKLRISPETEAWVKVAQGYRLAAAIHESNCARLVEYIIHLRSTILASQDIHNTNLELPPLPEEIVHYIEYQRVHAGH
ncbi:hypothetical protein GY45DRAFT_1264319, partial [Cubamyces sp. BRFM 1775]